MRFRQIGNAVPPLLAEALGRSLKESLAARRAKPKRDRRDRFRDLLLNWHADNGRSYPWRSGAPAWHVLMAEMCLHRTRADQVLPVYQRLTEIAGTPGALVQNAEAARQVMRPLGLNWRVENIIAVAETLVRLHNGSVPETSLELRTLPGVGDYVANAVLCFASGRRSVLLDTNTERIVGRVRGAASLRRAQMRMDLYDLAGREGPDRNFNYALLDLGALVCRAVKPMCSTCPLRGLCATGSLRTARSMGVLSPEMQVASEA